MDLKYESLHKRFSKASATREQWRSIHKEACEYCLPNHETFDLYDEGEDKTTRIFDSTAPEALSAFANRIQSSVLPPWQQWADLVVGSDVSEDVKEKTNEQLEYITDVVFSAINHSNFYQELSPALQDLGIGTGCLIVEPGVMGNRLKFTCVPLSQLYPEKPVNGVIESIWQSFKIPPQNILATWPMAKLGDKLKKMADKPNADDVQILNAQLFDTKKNTYHHVVLSPDDKKVIFHREYSYKRFLPFRWEVTPGETFGRGVAINNLSDVKTLNKMVEQLLAGAAYSINPMMTAQSDGIFNPYTVRMQAGAIIPVGSNSSSSPTLAPLITGNNIQHGSMVVAEWQAKIKDAFFASPLGEVTDPVKSATEQMLRMQEMLRRSGASFGRLYSELVTPLMKSIVAILTEGGYIYPVEINGTVVNIEQQSPMAKTQKVEEFQNLQMWAQFNMGMLPPEVANMGIKLEDFPSVSAEMLGITTKLQRDEEEKQQLAAQTQKAMQEGAQDGSV